MSSSDSIAARFLFLVDAALVVYVEFLRFTVVPPVTEDGVPELEPAGIDAVMHRAARTALALAFVLCILGRDVRAYRGLLFTGIWISFSSICPLLATYEYGSNSWVIILSTLSVLMLAHIGVYASFPFNSEFLRKYRRLRGELMSSADESYGAE